MVWLNYWSMYGSPSCGYWHLPSSQDSWGYWHPKQPRLVRVLAPQAAKTREGIGTSLAAKTREGIGTPSRQDSWGYCSHGTPNSQDSLWYCGHGTPNSQDSLGYCSHCSPCCQMTITFFEWCAATEHISRVSPTCWETTMLADNQKIFNQESPHVLALSQNRNGPLDC